VSTKPEQFAGGALPNSGRGAEVRAVGENLHSTAAEKVKTGSPVERANGNGQKPCSKRGDSRAYIDSTVQEFFSFRDLANRWRVSRSAVYVFLRGYPVIDFAPAPGRKGHKLVSAETVRQIERERQRVMR